MFEYKEEIMAKDRCDIYCYNEEKVNRIKSSSTVIVERDEDNHGKRIFWIYTVSKKCPLHRARYLPGKGIIYI